MINLWKKESFHFQSIVCHIESSESCFGYFGCFVSLSIFSWIPFSAIAIQQNFQWEKKERDYHPTPLYTYLIKSSKLCSFSLITFDGLAAISHNNFGRHASRILFASVILSFKSICSNFVLELDFFAMNCSMSSVDGESKCEEREKEWKREKKCKKEWKREEKRD